MVKILPLLLLLSGLFFTSAGCSSTSGLSASDVRSKRHWVAAQGGLCEAHGCEQRLRAICEELVGVEQAAAFRCRVLDSDQVAAYSWPESDLYVTRGAMRTLPGDELVAAVAHELGHLIDDGYVPAPATLSGESLALPLDVELRADAIGVHLMRQAGHDARAMARLLTRLCGQTDPHAPHAEDLHTRIALLQR